MSPFNKGTPPYRVVYSELCRIRTIDLLVRAKAKGHFIEISQVIRDIHRRLEWIPLDFGEPLREFVHLGIKLYIGVLTPFVVKYGVDEARHIVYVHVPFSVLPNTDL